MPKWMFRPMAASAYAAVVGAKSSPRMLESMVMKSIGQPTLFCLPKMPCGRISRTRIRIGQRAGVAHVAGNDERAHIGHNAHDQGAHQSAVRGAEATERDGGEHEHKQRDAGVPGDAVEVDANEHAGERGQAAGEDPHDAHHRIHVDARGRRKRRVVGHGSGGAAQSRAVEEHGDGDYGHQCNGRRDERRGVRDDRAELNALRHRLDNALDVTAEEELVDVLQRHRQADRHRSSAA